MKSGADGVCQQYNKRIAVREVSDMLDDTGDMKAKKLRYNEVCRHEAIHAFFGEAGLYPEKFQARRLKFLVHQTLIRLQM